MIADGWWATAIVRERMRDEVGISCLALSQIATNGAGAHVLFGNKGGKGAMS